MRIITTIKSKLLHRDWPDAIELLEQVEKYNQSGLEKWLKSSSTLDCREMCEPFRRSVRYRMMGEYNSIQFSNDVDALDTVIANIGDQL